MTKPRECPFCGTAQTVRTVWQGTWWVICDEAEGGCGASGPEHRTQEDAERAWNTRPGERAAVEAMGDLLAACKGLIQWMLNEDALRRLGFNPERAMKDYHFAKEVIAKVEGR